MIELLLVSALAMPVHDTQILNCNEAVKRSVKIEEFTIQNGLLGEAYDVDGDGKPDIITLSTIAETTPTGGVGAVPHTAYPLFYVIDNDRDGRFDVVLIDKDGQGFCESIVLYQDLNGPVTPNSSRTVPQGGRTGL